MLESAKELISYPTIISAMPHLRGLSGIFMMRRYVSNWLTVLAIYVGLLQEAEIRFRDGLKVSVAKEKFDRFYEELYKRHNIEHGFRYDNMNGLGSVLLPSDIRISFGHEPVYSFILDEIFIMKVYGEPNVSKRIVIDVGASIGDSALYFASLGAEVYGFEPNLQRYQTAFHNVKLNKLENKIHLFNYGLGGGNGPGSLAHFLLQNSMDNVFVKLDCEGCEYDVMMSTDDTIFQRVNDIVIEYHGNSKSLIERINGLGFDVKIKGEIIYASRKRTVELGKEMVSS